MQNYHTRYDNVISCAVKNKYTMSTNLVMDNY